MPGVPRRMTTVTYQTCKFCGKVIETKKTEIGNFNFHIFTDHKNEPEVKKYLELQNELQKLHDAFCVKREVIQIDRRGEK